MKFSQAVNAATCAVLLSLIALGSCPLAIAQQDTTENTETPLRDGQIKNQADGSIQSWDAETELWLDPQKFWESYAARGLGQYWGRLTEFPKFANSKEFDTFIYETKEGSCLMEFFHKRWRRANDVRRWDPQYAGYSGCATVFKN